MKIINMSFLAALLLLGTDLVARAAMQGLELALVLTAFEYSCSWGRRVSRWARTLLSMRSTSGQNEGQSLKEWL
jgi:hypothetical protein